MLMHRRRWARLVEAYVDRALPPGQAEQVAAHLRACWWCSEDAELLRMIKASLRRRGRNGSLTGARLRRLARRLPD
jgi:anti-sigma factor RsiW